MSVKGKLNFYISGFYSYLPFVICLITLLVGASIEAPSGFGLTLPAIYLIAVFYWSVYESENLNIFQVFLLGFLSDIFFGNPMGSGCILMIFLRELSFRMSFLIPPTSYLLSCILASTVLCIYFLINWFFFSLYYQNFSSLKYILLQLILTISIYPAFMIIFGWLGKFMQNRKN